MSITATMASIAANQAMNRKRAFEHHLEAFLKKWTPEDRDAAWHFNTELVMMVRQIYEDAQQPILDRFTQLAMSMPLPMLTTKP